MPNDSAAARLIVIRTSFSRLLKDNRQHGGVASNLRNRDAVIDVPIVEKPALGHPIVGLGVEDRLRDVGIASHSIDRNQGAPNIESRRA